MPGLLPPLPSEILALSNRPIDATETDSQYFFFRGFVAIMGFGLGQRAEGFQRLLQWGRKEVSVWPGHSISIDFSWNDLQRDAWVACSLAQWLGTRCGLDFLNLVTREQDSRLSRRSLASIWSRENTPSDFARHGYTLLQIILDQNRLYEQFRRHTPGDPSLIDPVSLRDKRVAELIILWLNTQEGDAFIAKAEEQIKAYEVIAREVWHLQFNLGVLAA